MINCLILSFLSIETLYSQVEIVSVYPAQNYLTAPRETDLYAVLSLDLDESTVVDTNIVVFAERTGTHFGNISYDAGSKTITFDPDNDFLAGERVRVTLTNGIKSASGESFRGFTWHFTVETFATGDISFIYRGEVPAGASFHLNSADFDNDGYPDIITVQNVYGNRVYLYLNDRNGGFFFHKILLDTDLFIPDLTIVLDFNRDGFVDIHIPARHIFIMNQGNGEFKNIYADSLFLFWSFGTDTDFDNDGELDMVISPWKVDSLCVYRGLGDFRFEMQYCRSLRNSGTFDSPTEEVFDLNNDGLADLIFPIAGYVLDSLFVLMNQRNLTFLDPVIYDPDVGLGFGGQYTNDLDKDGDMDHIFFGGPGSDSAKALLSNDGRGQFTFGDYYPTLPTGTVFGGDFDSDGDIDFITGWTETISVMPWITEGHIAIIRNDGYDSFVEDRHFTIGNGIEQAIFLDYDLDGDLDIVGIRLGYFLFWMENTSILSVKDETRSSLPEGFELFQNYPNPFNRSTEITYQIPESIQVILKIYDVKGREIRTLVNQLQHSGVHQVTWDGLDSTGREVSSGIYFTHINAKGFSKTGKMLLLR